MHIQNEKYSVDISIDRTYTLDSADNRDYDYVFNPCNMERRKDFYTVFCIEVTYDDDFHRVVLVAPDGGFHYNCAILEEDTLVFLRNTEIFQINLKYISVEHTSFELFGSIACGIYKIPDGYIIHGELEIVKLDKNFNKLWGFCGRDIFVTTDDSAPFEIAEDRIKLCDFEGNYYELDFDGNLIG